MEIKINTLLGHRLFHNSKGETLILQKGLRANDNRPFVSLFKLDGINVIPVAEKIYGENHSAKTPDIYKHHKLNEQIVTRTKKGNNLIASNNVSFIISIIILLHEYMFHALPS